MQLSYNEHGMQCEFTLMTIGDYRGGSETPAPAVVRHASAASAANQPSRQSTVQIASIQKPNGMPPPTETASRSFTREPQSQRTQRPSPPPPKASLDPESLFLPADEDEDRLWGERNYDDDEDTLGWNASAKNVRCGSILHSFVDHEIQVSELNDMRKASGSSSRLEPYPAWPEDPNSRIAPTQRISDVCYLVFNAFAEVLIPNQITTLFGD